MFLNFDKISILGVDHLNTKTQFIVPEGSRKKVIQIMYRSFVNILASQKGCQYMEFSYLSIAKFIGSRQIKFNISLFNILINIKVNCTVVDSFTYRFVDENYFSQNTL